MENFNILFLKDKNIDVNLGEAINLPPREGIEVLDGASFWELCFAFPCFLQDSERTLLRSAGEHHARKLISELRGE